MPKWLLVPEHPALSLPEHLDEARQAVAESVGNLWAGLDRGDADIYNDSFAADVLWGGPYGATIRGYDELQPDPSRSEIVDVSVPTAGVALAQVRRVPQSDDEFTELALYVLTRAHGWHLKVLNTTTAQGN